MSLIPGNWAVPPSGYLLFPGSEVLNWVQASSLLVLASSLQFEKGNSEKGSKLDIGTKTLKGHRSCSKQT